MNRTTTSVLGDVAYGVEPFDVGYGASFAAEADSPMDVECELTEDDGVLAAHDTPPRIRPERLAFVDATMQTDARLTRTGPDGIVHVGLAGFWAAGAVLIESDKSPRVDLVTTERVTVFCGGEAVGLRAQPGGWSWVADAVEASDFPSARQRLQRRMRDAEGVIAERLCAGGWVTVVDGPLNNIRRTRTQPVVGYVKTHQRRMLDPANWARVPMLGVGQRSSVFVINDDLYGTYLRIGDAGPWSSPWGGIVRLEVPSGAGRRAATDALDAAASWLPQYASAAHRDARAPVNLTPIAGLERALRRYSGDARLALRAVRAAIVELNQQGGPS